MGLKDSIFFVNIVRHVSHLLRLEFILTQPVKLQRKRTFAKHLWVKDNRVGSGAGGRPGMEKFPFYRGLSPQSWGGRRAQA